MSKFSFDFKTKATTGTSTTPTTSNATASMMKYYTDLCIQKFEEVQDITDYKEVSEEITRLRAIISPSTKQLELIASKEELLTSICVIFERPSPLTGGKDGSASAYIGELIELESASSLLFPPTDSQLEYMVGMYFCPDAPFENFGISKKVFLEGELWRRMTPDEFAMEIKANMSKADASKFIDDYRGAFFTWKDSRIKDGQVNYIRSLEQRMNQPKSSVSTETVVDAEGNKFEMPVASNKEAVQTLYEPLEESGLRMMSTEDASTYIDRLKSELARTELYTYGEFADGNDTLESKRIHKGKKELEDAQYDADDAVLYKIESIMGMDLPDMHELSLTSSTDRETMKKFMCYSVDEGFIKLGALLEVITDTVYMDILTE